MNKVDKLRLILSGKRRKESTSPTRRPLKGADQRIPNYGSMDSEPNKDHNQQQLVNYHPKLSSSTLSINEQLINFVQLSMNSVFTCRHVFARQNIILLLIIIIISSSLVSSSSSSLNRNNYNFVHCKEVFTNYPSIRLPCLCSTSDDEQQLSNATFVDCDFVSFFGDFPTLPFRSKIITFSQRFAGIQNLEPQLFTASDIKIENLDFSHNLIRRLRERMLDGIDKSLIQLNFSHNHLGDQLNPIFATNEFYSLPNLKILDLSYNQLKALDSNIFKGIQNLTVSLYK